MNDLKFTTAGDYMSSARAATNKLLELIEEGVLTSEQVLSCALSYMSEADVKDMAECNELLEEEEVY
tara:strand:+ start:1101 stop:1301 length:201 start_codon:yes stop_codon:yes gene_type:complete